MYGQITSGRPPISEPIDIVLGKELSAQGKKFAAQHADFLVRVDFKDIAEHQDPFIRSAEAHCSSDGVRHTIWLDRESPDFEGLMMHQAMRGFLMERGFPKTTCSPFTPSYPFLRYLSSLLSSAVTDPIIDGWLMKGGYGVYDRELLIRTTMGKVWLDARQGTPRPFGFLFCKWTMLTVLLRLDPTFEGESTNLLHALIRKKFPVPAKLGNNLSALIKKNGFTEPYPALIAMLALRSSLNLQNKIPIVDGEGRHF